MSKFRASVAIAALMMVTPAMAGTCAGWHRVYATDIARLNALAGMDGGYRGGDGPRPHEALFDKTVKLMNEDRLAASADGCGWGD